MVVAAEDNALELHRSSRANITSAMYDIKAHLMRHELKRQFGLYDCIATCMTTLLQLLHT
jgi:hypothetical protein